MRNAGEEWEFEGCVKCIGYGAAAGQLKNSTRPDVSEYMEVVRSLSNDVQLVGLDEHC